MDDGAEKKAGLSQEPSRTPEDGEIRTTIERAREAIEESSAEIERSRRLLRETEDLVNPPTTSQPESAQDERSADPRRSA